MRVCSCFTLMPFLLLVGSSGCTSQPSAPAVVRGVTVNDYDFEYDFVPPLSFNADDHNVTVTSGTTVIRVADGKLSVDGKSFGSVKKKDKISVVGGKVTVNGEERKPGS